MCGRGLGAGNNGNSKLCCALLLFCGEKCALQKRADGINYFLNREFCEMRERFVVTAKELYMLS